MRAIGFWTRAIPLQRLPGPGANNCAIIFILCLHFLRRDGYVATLQLFAKHNKQN